MILEMKGLRKIMDLFFDWVIQQKEDLVKLRVYNDDC